MLVWSQSLGSLFCVLFAILWLGGLFGATSACVLWKRGGWQKKAAGWIIAALGTLGAAFLVTMGLMLYAQHAGVRDALKTIRGHAQSRAVFYARGSWHEIDPAEVAEFFAIVDRGEGVGAHHSHPVNEIELHFPDDGYTFLIGPDSARTDEYWFSMKDYPGRSPNSGDIQIRQFHSAELTGWIGRNYFPSSTSRPGAAEQAWRSMPRQ